MHHDAAPCAPRSERASELPLLIELERGGDFRPRTVEQCGDMRSEHFGELLHAERETCRSIHLPDEAKRGAARRRFRRSRTWRKRRGLGRGGPRDVCLGGVGSGGQEGGWLVRAGARKRRGWRRGGPRNVGWRGIVEGDQQRDRIAGAEPQYGGGPNRDLALGAAVERSLARQRVGTERDEILLAAEAFERRPRHLDGFAVGGVDSGRLFEIRDKALRTVGQAQVLAAAFG